MHRRETHLGIVAAVAVVAVLAGFMQAAQAADRPVQHGTKVVDAMYVAWAGKTSAPQQLDADISQGLEDLWAACVDNGLHPAGPVVVAAGGGDQGGAAVSWEAWLPIADQPTPDDLANQGPVPIKLVPQVAVAYTYHVGDPSGIQMTFQALAGWAQGQGLTLTGRARVVVNMTPMDGQAEHFVRECQLELQGQAGGGQ